MYRPDLLRLVVALAALMSGAIIPEAFDRAHGQTFTSLYQFKALSASFANMDGAFPAAGLIVQSNTLFGTTSQGGETGGGTAFKINTDGTQFTVLHTFTPANPATGTPGDGAYPLGSLILSGSTLFGTTSSGGSSNNGIVFKVDIDGTKFTTLHTFSASAPNTYVNADGAYPWAGLAISGNTLYGTTTRGGGAGSGSLFKLNRDGSGFTSLYSFTALDPGTGTNSDGAYPLGGLLVWSNALYGTAYRGGALGTGTVFRVNLDGSGFVTLHSTDGGPRASLLIASNALYGTTESGGDFGGGTVFVLNTDGTGFTNLQNFVNDPGNGPWAGLSSTGSTLFGTTYAGGDSGQGSVFGLSLDGTSFTNIYSFVASTDGAHPQASVAISGNVLYGTASEAGNSGDGTVFMLAPSPGTQPLTIALSGDNAILSWPTNLTGLTLQTTTNLTSAPGWIAVTQAPTVVNGLNTVTNPISDPARFYRLGQ